MTEHEGFCVPLIEAMTFELPIFAYAEEGVSRHHARYARVAHEPDPAFPTGVAKVESERRPAILTGRCPPPQDSQKRSPPSSKTQV